MAEKWCKTFFNCWCACRFGTSVKNTFGLCGRSIILVVWLMIKRSGRFAHGHEVLLLIFFWEYRVDLIIATVIKSIRKILVHLRIEISKFAQIGAHKNDFLRYVPIVALKIRIIGTHKTGLKHFHFNGIFKMPHGGLKNDNSPILRPFNLPMSLEFYLNIILTKKTSTYENIST